MQSLNIVFFLVALVGGAVAAKDYYTGRWNYVDTHVIIDNARLYNRYEQCILGSSATRCNPDLLELKERLTQALQELCAKCSSGQIVKIKDALSYICQKRPDSFARILAKVDPETIYRPLFEAKFGTIEGGC